MPGGVVLNNGGGGGGGGMTEIKEWCSGTWNLARNFQGGHEQGLGHEAKCY